MEQYNLDGEKINKIDVIRSQAEFKPGTDKKIYKTGLDYWKLTVSEKNEKDMSEFTSKSEYRHWIGTHMKASQKVLPVGDEGTTFQKDLELLCELLIPEGLEKYDEDRVRQEKAMELHP